MNKFAKSNELILYLCNKNGKTMTTQEFKTIATNKLNVLSTTDLIAEVKKLANDFSTGAELVSDVAMDILMNRLPENEFVELCNTLKHREQVRGRTAFYLNSKNKR